MATRKAYNSPDSENHLILVERRNEDFGGYRQDLLVDTLTPLEVDNYVCTKCRGVMVNACQIGEEQTPVCQGCAGPSAEVMPMLRSRKRIPELKSKCPLYTRGCVWKGKLQETREHLEVCQEFIVVCPNVSRCEVFVKRSELRDHLTQCQMRIVRCEYCTENIVFQDLIPHYGECLDYPLECPNECRLTLKRGEMEAHVFGNCVNIQLECPYRYFGCKDGVERGHMNQHKTDNKFKHLELKSEFALDKLHKIEQTHEDNNLRILEKLDEYAKGREESRKDKRETAKKLLILKQMLDEQENKAATQATKQKQVEELLGEIIEHKNKEISDLTKGIDEQRICQTEETFVLRNMIEEQQQLIQSQNTQFDKVSDMIKAQKEDIVELRKNFNMQQGKLQTQANKHQELQQTVKKKSDEIAALRNKVQEQKTMIQAERNKQKEMEATMQRNFETALGIFVPNTEAPFGHNPSKNETPFGHIPPNAEVPFEHTPMNNEDALRNFQIFWQDMLHQQVAREDQIYITLEHNKEEILELGNKLEKQKNKLEILTNKHNEVEESVKKNNKEITGMSKKLEEQKKIMEAQINIYKRTHKHDNRELEGPEIQLNEIAVNQNKLSEDVISNSKALEEQQKMLKFLTTGQKDLGESMKRKSQEMVEFTQQLHKQKTTMQKHVSEVEETLKGEISELHYNMMNMQQSFIQRSHPRPSEGECTYPYPFHIKKNPEFERGPTGPDYKPVPPKEQESHMCNQS